MTTPTCTPSFRASTINPVAAGNTSLSEAATLAGSAVFKGTNSVMTFAFAAGGQHVLEMSMWSAGRAYTMIWLPPGTGAIRVVGEFLYCSDSILATSSAVPGWTLYTFIIGLGSAGIGWAPGTPMSISFRAAFATAILSAG